MKTSTGAAPNDRTSKAMFATGNGCNEQHRCKERHQHPREDSTKFPRSQKRNCRCACICVRTPHAPSTIERLFFYLLRSRVNKCTDCSGPPSSVYGHTDNSKTPSTTTQQKISTTLGCQPSRAPNTTAYNNPYNANKAPQDFCWEDDDEHPSRENGAISVSSNPRRPSPGRPRCPSSTTSRTPPWR